MSIEIKISKKRIPYKMAMLYLNKRVEKVKKGTNRELLWILEHPTTYTAGVSFNKKEIIDKKIKIVKIKVKLRPIKVNNYPNSGLQLMQIDIFLLLNQIHM